MCPQFLHKRTLALEGESSDQWVVLGSAAAVIGFLGRDYFETHFYDSEVIMILYYYGFTIPRDRKNMLH